MNPAADGFTKVQVNSQTHSVSVAKKANSIAASLKSTFNVHPGYDRLKPGSGQNAHEYSPKDLVDNQTKAALGYERLIKGAEQEADTYYQISEIYPFEPFLIDTNSDTDTVYVVSK